MYDMPSCGVGDVVAMHVNTHQPQAATSTLIISLLRLLRQVKTQDPQRIHHNTYSRGGVQREPVTASAEHGCGAKYDCALRTRLPQHTRGTTVVLKLHQGAAHTETRKRRCSSAAVLKVLAAINFANCLFHWHTPASQPRCVLSSRLTHCKSLATPGAAPQSSFAQNNRRAARASKQRPQAVALIHQLRAHNAPLNEYGSLTIKTQHAHRLAIAHR